MSPTDATTPSRPARWGLAAKLFAILLLLGAIAVLVTGVLGYIRARDALEKAIYNQLTAARQTKARQVETYFRTIRNELRLLAASKMVVDADARVPRSPSTSSTEPACRPNCARRSATGTTTHFMPEMRRLLGQGAARQRLPAGRRAPPTICSTTTSSPIRIPADRRKLLDDAGDGSDYSRLHAIYHPLMRAAAATRRLLRLHDGRPQVRPPHLHGREGGGFRHVPAASVPTAAPTSPPPSPAARATPDRSAICLEDFAPYAPSRRRADRLHGGAGDRPGRRHRRAGRAIVDRGDRQRRHRRPPLAAGRLRRHRRGLSRRTRLSACAPARGRSTRIATPTSPN